MSKRPKKFQPEWHDSDEEEKRNSTPDPYGPMTDAHKFHGTAASSESTTRGSSPVSQANRYTMQDFARSLGMRIEGKSVVIDLHQLKLAEALQRVEHILHAVIADGRIKQIRVITGRGNHSHGGGVLAREVQPYVAGRFARYLTQITDSPHEATIGGHPARGYFDLTLRN